MGNLYTYIENKCMPVETVENDAFVKELLASEFGGKACISSPATRDLIKKCGFGWDFMSKQGYLAFKPYAAFMEEATKLFVWKNVQTFCQNIKLPLHRIAGSDLYSLENPLMKRHKQLAESVGMYGNGLLEVTGKQILRFSGCTNKLSMLKQVNLDDRELPFGIFEISDSYRYEKEEELDYLVRNRFFHLPELHIVNEDLNGGLHMLLACHRYMQKNMNDHNLDYIMLFSTTQKFVDDHLDFIRNMCKDYTHPPVLNIASADTCENGIVFDVEYKACLGNGILVEIGTFQIDEGSTGFAYDIRYKNKPVATVHAVFFASSIERTIYTYCDLAANGHQHIPKWLAPIHCRIIPMADHYKNCALEKAQQLLKFYRVEVDDRSFSFEDKVKDAISLKVPYILSIDAKTKMYDMNTGNFKVITDDNQINMNQDESFILNQFSPVLLSQRILF